MTPAEMYVEALEAACGFLADHDLTPIASILVVPTWDYSRGEASTVHAEIPVTTTDARRLLESSDRVVKVHNGVAHTLVYVRVSDELVVHFAVSECFAMTPRTVGDVLRPLEEE